MELTIARELKSILKPELERLNQRLVDLARQSDGAMGDLLHYVLLGSGKRVRPALVFLGSQLGESQPGEVRVVEEAVELIHIASLIHDDVIDKAALRRGRKTVSEEFGVDTAVLLGDHIYATAFEHLSELGQPQITRLLARSTSIMCAGEIDQLKNRFGFYLTETDYFSFIEKKTASLFGASARSGAILAHQSTTIQNAVETYAVNLGIAFQITDDLLDLVGDEAVVGKTLRTDLLNGKMTLPLIHYRESLASSEQKNELIQILQSPNGQLPNLINRLKLSGSILYSEQVVDRHIQLALGQLESLPPSDVRDHLARLADILEHRST